MASSPKHCFPLRAAALGLVVVACPALAQVSTVGDIVVVQDPSGGLTNIISGMGAILPSPQEQFCRAAYNAARASGLGDDYDGVFTFSAYDGWSDLNNVWQGPPVRADAQNIGRQNAPWLNTYDSARLGQCAFLGTLSTTVGFLPGTPGTEPLPPLPDSNWSPSLGIPIPGLQSLTGIEMLGHEYGHHWLLGVTFDQGQGAGEQHYIRGFDDSANNEGGQGAGSPNQHYSAYADSRSVMYGECITEVDAGTYTFAGCERKYSHLDQYLMGLRGPAEVQPMMVLEKQSDLGHGSPAIASARGSSRTESGYLKHFVSADDIIRSMGPRTPAYPNTQRCWRVAFMVVLAPGQTTIPTALWQKVERYRARWGPWFSFATDGRGVMSTALNADECATFDGGVVDVDAGVDLDGGAEDAGTGDGGLIEGPGAQPDAGPSKWDTVVPNDTGKLRDGCGCHGVDPLSLGAGGAVLLAWLCRRQRR